MTTDPEYVNIQLNLPHHYYGATSFFPPSDITSWWKNQGIMLYYVGQELPGGFGYVDESGFRPGVSCYNATKVLKEDILIFKIHFPNVQIYVHEYIDPTKIAAEEAMARTKKEVLLQRRRNLYATKKNSRFRGND